jgi:YfiH family protein
VCGGVGVKLDPDAQSRHPAGMIFLHDNMLAWEGVVHGFSTSLDRTGRPLDLGSNAKMEDWRRLATDAGFDGAPVAFSAQVHGAECRYADGPGSVGDADAIWTDVPGLLLAVRTADCVPILVAGPGVVAAIHAGWRGLAGGVIPAAVEVLAGHGPLHAVVGPSICMGCYEVGEEVVAGIAQWVPEARFVDRTTAKPHVDPGAAAVAQLEAAGISSVERIGICTQCDDRLWSHRQTGSLAGRQVGVIGLTC